jgi:uncharacterized membrane protein (UPF0127 family)
MKFVKIINETNPQTRLIRAKYCQSFLCQLRGLMLVRGIQDDEGLLLVQGSDSRINSSIHMMFMRIDLAVIWINHEFFVVDKVLARRWKPGYLPKSPARYVLETGVSHFPEYNIGDKVRLDASD